ncbi:MAG: exopolysaccharide biosynthesis protein [Opitutales bacterium]|nr:exopolysaccharide biosynthesis protein [Opitutales bacterium]
MERLSEQIRHLCNEQGELSTTLSELNHRLQEQSLGIFIILLSFPSALPIPAAGYSTPFGILLMWTGILLMRGKRQLQLPKKWLQKPLKLSAKMIGCGIRFIAFLEKFIHPNRAASLCRFLNVRFIGLNIFLLALIMAIPIPLTNTIPGGSILLFGLGLLENDGLVLFFAQCLSLVLITIYTAAAFWVATFGLESLQYVLRTLHLWS